MSKQQKPEGNYMDAWHDEKPLTQIEKDHRDWPLGTIVYVRRGHHSPRPLWGFGHVDKHGYPCKDGINCIVRFPRPVMDTTFGAARYCHYVDYKNLVKVRDVLWRLALGAVFAVAFAYFYFK